MSNPGGGSPQTDQPESGPVGAWVLFLVFGVLIAAHGLYMLVLPSVDPLPGGRPPGHRRGWALWLALFIATVITLSGTYPQFFRRPARAQAAED